MEKILAGIRQFQSNVVAEKEAVFKQLSKGQKPPVLLITCSDSRICPTMMTQSDLGDLFVLRTAGNIVPPYGAVQGGEAATIEYAVGVLNIPDIIICGHSHCGAMHGLLNPASLEKFPSVKSYLQHAEATRRVVEELHGDLDDHKEKVRLTIEQNVLVQMNHLMTHPSVAAAVKSGKVRLHGWVYTIESGEIFEFNEDEQRFVSLNLNSAPERTMLAAV
ncbi:carbonic anhydrase [Planctomicrobium sp. SH668]|uniref:carbonic anhydrase n=1 Tax=Planctomicrobium sp. SH668 TaxID=3448126 RepID=UPI003F5C1BB8